MSNPVLRLARTAVVAFTLVGPSFTGALADDTSNLIVLDEPTATMLVMLDVIDFAGSDEMGNDYFALGGTDMICYMSEKDARSSESEQEEPSPAKK